MDLKINNMSFQGKHEIMYGLKKAAKISRVTELTNKAYITSRMGMTKYEEMTAYDASMRAYLDMATHDAEFANVINRSLSTEDVNSLKEILKPEITQHGSVEPLGLFTEVIQDVAKTKHRGTKALRAVETLINMLK